MLAVWYWRVGGQGSRSQDTAQFDEGAILPGEQISTPAKPSEAGGKGRVTVGEIGMKLGHLGNVGGLFLGPVVVVELDIDRFVAV
jgi:hypothetical protein